MDWIDVLPVAIPFALAVVLWFLQDRSKFNWEQHKRKEERYVKMFNSLSGFYANADPDKARAKKVKFVDQLRLAWLYCPDEVIRKSNAFLDTIKAGNPKPKEKQEEALGEFVLEARKDLMGKGWLWRKKTKLAPDEFKTWTST